MLIEYNIVDHFTGGGGLWLSCYSYQEREFQSVVQVIRNSGIELRSERLPPDKEGRIGIRFVVESDDIHQLEKYLKIRFDFSGNIQSTGSTSYRCERVTILSQPKNCETIYADDDHSAKVICSLKAKDRGWFGGVTQRGACR